MPDPQPKDLIAALERAGTRRAIRHGAG